MVIRKGTNYEQMLSLDNFYEAASPLGNNASAEV